MDFRLAPAVDTAPVTVTLDTVIAGGGPAALSAALYGARYGLDLLVLESWQPGGQAALTALIENYPGVPSVTGARLTGTMREQAAEAGARFTSDTALEASPRAICCWSEPARGNSGPEPLSSPRGPHLRDSECLGRDRYIGRGRQFLRHLRRPPSTRARKVVVVGGGDSAVKEALHLARVAESLVLVHRRDRLRAEPALARSLLSCPPAR
jgi:thioredoxin reductase (NADPH)